MFFILRIRQIIICPRFSILDRFPTIQQHFDAGEGVVVGEGEPDLFVLFNSGERVVNTREGEPDQIGDNDRLSLSFFFCLIFLTWAQ